jgi:dihydrolipoamide dehydrogenase
MKFYVSHKVKSVERNGDAVTVQAENAKGDTTRIIALFLLVVVLIRRIECRESRSEISDKGMVEVNDHLQTNIPNIYA